MGEILRTDVLVVGGGPAGIGAAIASARTGVPTLLIERHGFLGGIASFSMGMCMNQMRPDGEKRSLVHELLIEKLMGYGEQAYRFSNEVFLKYALFTNVEYLKVAILDALDDVGCKYLVHLRAVDALVEGDRVTGVVVATKSGLVTIRAKCVVDCTGDADVAAFAGCETLKDPIGSPMTVCFNVTNIDMEQARAVGSEEKMKPVAARAKHKYPLIPDTWDLTPFASSACFYINHAGTRVFGPMDPTDPEEITRAECMSRRQILQMLAAMREFGGEVLSEIEIVAASPQIGVRESRRVKGVYVLTEQDSLSGRRFDDAVAWRSGALDIGYVRSEPMPTHDVPYRCILPEVLDGLLVGGRCISTDHPAASAGKSMGNCMATGHAAGLAAAMAVQRRCVPRDLNVSLLQEGLRADGVDLDRAGNNVEYTDDSGKFWRWGENWNP